MSIITSDARFRQRVVKYSFKNGVTKASDRFGRSRQAIYEWRAKWDGKRASWFQIYAVKRQSPDGYEGRAYLRMPKSEKISKDAKLKMWKTPLVTVFFGTFA